MDFNYSSSILKIQILNSHNVQQPKVTLDRLLHVIDVVCSQLFVCFFSVISVFGQVITKCIWAVYWIGLQNRVQCTEMSFGKVWLYCFCWFSFVEHLYVLDWAINKLLFVFHYFLFLRLVNIYNFILYIPNNSYSWIRLKGLDYFELYPFHFFFSYDVFIASRNMLHDPTQNGMNDTLFTQILFFIHLNTFLNPKCNIAFFFSDILQFHQTKNKTLKAF